MIPLELYQESAEFLKKKGITKPATGIILGTGLGNLVKEITIELEIPYSEIPGFPIATVEFHSGKLIYGKIGEKQVLVMNGRFHYYEGYSMQQIAFPVRVMKLLGITKLFISNAAGCMNLDWRKGDLMLIRDHINLLPDNPLIGKNLEEFGPRFPDMSETYSPELRKKMKAIAAEASIVLHEGVYVAVTGPNLETAAEYRFLRKIGADAVGMSTIPEVITAHHAGIPVLAISVLTDECDPENLKAVDISEIIAIAGKAELKLTTLFKKIIQEDE